MTKTAKAWGSPMARALCGFNDPAWRSLEYPVHVVDAEQDRLVEVSARVVRTCQPGSTTECAIARALRLLLDTPGLQAVVGSNFCYYPNRALKTGRWQITRYRIPSETRKALEGFDQGAGFNPGLYRLLTITPGRTRAHQSAYKKAWNAKIAAGHKPKAYRLTTGTVYRRYVTGKKVRVAGFRPAQPVAA